METVVMLTVRKTLPIAALVGVMLVLPGCERTPAAPADGPVVAGQAEAPAPADVETPPAPVAEAAGAAAEPTPTVAAEPASSAAPRVIAYYFHRTLRCATCLLIEEQSREALELSHGEELDSGRLEWHAVNIEMPGNEHFEQEYGVEAAALVLVEMVGEQVTRWTMLPEVWDLAEHPHELQEYVTMEAALFLGG
jgi:hypothetical protein